MRGLNFLYKAENTYGYDGNNYRVFKQTPTEKTYYSYDGSGNLRFERRGRTEINYIYDAGGIRGMKVTVPTDDPSTYYLSKYDLLNHCIIDGHPLIEIVKDIK